MPILLLSPTLLLLTENQKLALLLSHLILLPTRRRTRKSFVPFENFIVICPLFQIVLAMIFMYEKKSKPTIFGRCSLFYHLRLPMKKVNHGISRAYTGSVIKELSCTTNLSCSICSSDIESRIATLDSCISLFSFSFTTLDLLKREPLANPLQSL